jgi:hypothetical protein
MATKRTVDADTCFICGQPFFAPNHCGDCGDVEQYRCPDSCENRDAGTCPRCFAETAVGCGHGPICDDCVQDSRATTPEALAAKIEEEIRADMATGKIPTTVRSFASLHDFVEANEYGGLIVTEEEDIALLDDAQSIVDARLRDGAISPTTKEG